MSGMEELPRDFTKMFDYDVFKFDVDLIPQAKVGNPFYFSLFYSILSTVGQGTFSVSFVSCI